MTFYIDIFHIKDYTGKDIAYEPLVSFSISDKDEVDIETLKKLRDSIQEQMRVGINQAQKVYNQKHIEQI